MIVTPATLAAIAGRKTNSNMLSVVEGLAAVSVGLDAPHRLAHFLGQTCHESGGWTYDRELWGNTPAQIRYDTRTDLGNTAAKDGDGYLYRGRTGIQITGRANFMAFTLWCRGQGLNPPDFVAMPDATLTDPWEGLGPVWYWATRRRLGLTMNQMADADDIEAITRAVNGGLNGFEDRKACTLRAQLALAGAPDVRAFQKAYGLKVDGVAGPVTRGTLHRALLSARPVTFSEV
jgi:putative chitinase